LSADDIILWRSFTGGDRSSFEVIYRRYFGTLYEYGMRKVNDEELVKDTIQDLFIKLWANRKGIRETDHIKYYLLVSFKNTLLNVQARHSRRNTLPLGDPDSFYLPFIEAGPVTEEHKRQQSLRLLEALNQLSPRQKEVIYLRYFEEMDYDQIAGLLHIAVGGVYKLHYRALDALKEILHLSQNDLLLLLLLCKTHPLLHLPL